MKAKKFISVLIAGALFATAVTSVSAATLTEDAPDSSTEVTAKIEGSAPGEVSYTITIPDKVDFGMLTQPESEVDSNKYVGFEVEATELNIESGDYVSVYVNGYEDDEQFYITQQNVESPFKISYDIYTGDINDENIMENTAINNDESPTVNGYHFTSFGSETEGSVQPGTLVLNQKDLYGKDLDEIAGDYSGTMTFHSSIVSLP